VLELFVIDASIRIKRRRDWRNDAV